MAPEIKKSSYFNAFKYCDDLAKRADDGRCSAPGYRTKFMRDRDRILYAAAFRRLAGKTQIYTVNAVDDHRKNRLTHTLEVAQIARTIAKGLDLDEDLAEAIALGHDLGHTPFGHAGEETLHAIMTPKIEGKTIDLEGSPYTKPHADVTSAIRNAVSGYEKYAFGFKHNIQSVRVAAKLETAYRTNDESKESLGLNLTNYTLYGMMIHSKLKYDKHDEETDAAPNYYHEFDNQLMFNNPDNTSTFNTPAWSFEAFIVEHADDIAQWHHDLEDALLDGIMPMKKVCETVLYALDSALSDKQKEQLQDMTKADGLLRHNVTALSSIVVDTLVTNLVNTSKDNFEKLYDLIITDTEKRKETIKDMFRNYSACLPRFRSAGIIPHDANPTTPKEMFGWVLGFSDKLEISIFKKTIKNWIHHSRNVERMNAKGQYIIKELFSAYLRTPQLLPDGSVLHFLVDTNEYYLSRIWSPISSESTKMQEERELERKKYASLDSAREGGIGAARADFTERLKSENVYLKCVLMRRICDHIASMTDRYATEEYQKIYG